MATCRICERVLAEHSLEELAKCVIEDDRQKTLRRIACELSWERERAEKRLVKR